MDVAEAFRTAVAERWSDGQLPGSRWTDRAVEGRARDAVDRRLAPVLDSHRSEMEREEGTATAHDTAIADRDRRETLARMTNATVSGPRRRVEAEAQQLREALDRDYERRAALTEGMEPDEISVADAARDDYLWTEDPAGFALTTMGASGLRHGRTQPKPVIVGWRRLTSSSCL